MMWNGQAAVLDVALVTKRFLCEESGMPRCRVILELGILVFLFVSTLANRRELSSWGEPMTRQPTVPSSTYRPVQ